MEERKAYYAIIPATIRYDKDIKANAKLLYGEITAICNEKGYCWATNGYFAELYGVSKNTISVWINQLIKKGYLFSEIKYKNGTNEIDKRYLKLNEVPIIKNNDTPINKNDDTYNEESGDPIQENINTPITKNLKENNTVFNNTINNTLDNTISKDIVSCTKEQQVMNAWNSLKLNKVIAIKPGTARSKMLNARIKEYGLDNVIKAIGNIAESSFLKGQNRHNWIISLDWMLKPNNFSKVLEENYSDRNKAFVEKSTSNHEKPPLRFNNFEAREYYNNPDQMKSLEEKLLGWSDE